MILDFSMPGLPFLHARELPAAHQRWGITLLTGIPSEEEEVCFWLKDFAGNPPEQAAKSSQCSALT